MGVYDSVGGGVYRPYLHSKNGSTANRLKAQYQSSKTSPNPPNPAFHLKKNETLKPKHSSKQALIHLP